MAFPKKPNSKKRKIDESESKQHEPAEKETNGRVAKSPRCFDFAKYPRRKIAIQFLYYGWEYDGLVQQTNTNNTVERFLMDALTKTKLVEDRDNCGFSRCGRTDKGVSAFKQVAAFVVRSNDASSSNSFWPEGTDSSIVDSFVSKEELNYVKMLNGTLPKSIRVLAWSPVPISFSARHQCNMRVYKYSFPHASLDVERIRSASALLVGTHDFRNFCQIDMEETRVTMSYIRNIYSVDVDAISACSSSSYPLVELTICGSGFLWHQIRFIVSVLFDIGRGLEEPELISKLLDVESCPAKPHYVLASDTPLCLFDCKFDAVSDLKWIYDDYSLQKTVGSLQAKWAEMATRGRTIENMLRELSDGGDDKPRVDVNRGLLEFTYDRTIPARHVPFEERAKCDTIEMKRMKLDAKKMRADARKTESEEQVESIGE